MKGGLGVWLNEYGLKWSNKAVDMGDEGWIESLERRGVCLAIFAEAPQGYRPEDENRLGTRGMAANLNLTTRF